MWLAFNATWYNGGAAQVDDGEAIGSVNNARSGVTLSIPAGRQQSFKISYSDGVAVRTGTDFRTVAVAWQWLWIRS